MNSNVSIDSLIAPVAAPATAASSAATAATSSAPASPAASTVASAALSTTALTATSASATPATTADAREFTPLIQQYISLKQQNPNAILLFRCGDFYETFFEDAVIAAKELQITLTARGKSGGNPIPLAGVPHHSVMNYVAKLVQKGFTVAMCEQMEDPKLAKGLVKREIVRLLTPGTIADPQLLEENSHNFLVAYGRKADRFSLASVELSTGEFLICNGDAAEERQLVDEFTRLAPKEILYLADNVVTANQTTLPWRHLSAERHARTISEREAIDQLAALFPKEPRSRFLAMATVELRTLGIIADYLQETQRCALDHLRFPEPYRLGDGMVLDEATLRNLELLPQTRGQSGGGTLFEVIDRTRTSLGARTLRRWLLKPLIQVEAIRARQALVARFFENGILLADIREQLQNFPDLERLLTKLTLGGRNPRDLQALGTGLERLPQLYNTLASAGAGAGLHELATEVAPIPEVAELVTGALLEDLPNNLTDGGVIADGRHSELDELRGLLRDGDRWLVQFEERERETSGIKNLKVRRNNVFGYFIEISKSQAERAPDHYVRKQTLTTGERFITAELKDYENKVTTANSKIVAIEKELFEELVAEVRRYIPAIQRAAAGIARLDALAGLAQIARERRFVRPEICDDRVLVIQDGRHPVVESFIGSGEFRPNSVILNEERRQAIITGPNMAGKSTYLRQTALIVLLAQIGAYVPATAAKIGVVDRIFTRVGASDNLVRGQSTFMVEMMETSAILRHASARSLLVLDEIGRGTSTFDGLSLAWAILEHVHQYLGARTLFATHYHELTDLAPIYPHLFNLNVGVKHDTNTGDMVFLHEIQEGPASKSYGIEVARLAGIPNPILGRAKEILCELEKREHDEVGRVTRALQPVARPVQLTLFAPTSEVVEQLKELDINRLSPMDALQVLVRLQEMARG